MNNILLLIIVLVSGQVYGQENLNFIDPNDSFVTIQNSELSLEETSADLTSLMFDDSLPYEFENDEVPKEEIFDQGTHFLSASLELPIRNKNQIFDSQGNQLDSIDGMKTFILYDSSEFTNEQANASIDENPQDCIVIYSKCNYQGESMPICESLKEVEDFNYGIKSIYVPDGLQITVYSEESYEGDKVVYQESQKCLN